MEHHDHAEEYQAEEPYADEAQAQEDGISRRQFLRMAGLACGAGMLLVAGCSEGGAGASRLVEISSIAPDAFGMVEATPQGAGYLIKDAGKLQKGAAALFAAGQGQAAEPVVLFVASDGSLRALSGKCTHMGCQVEWRGEKTKEVLHCPCHSSQFDENGAVLGGPAKTPLPRFKVQTQGTDAIVTLA